MTTRSAATQTMMIIDVDPDDARLVPCLVAYGREVSEAIGVPFDLKSAGNPDPQDLRPPRGAFFLALQGELPIGCVALKGLGDQQGEVKRMWISPEARGLGLAAQLMDVLEARALALGMRRLVLDTNSHLGAALAFYRRQGWQEIERYNDNPYAEHFFEKWLSGDRQRVGGS